MATSLSDKEVGELWEWVAVISPLDGKVDNREVKKLIRKLVKERADFYSRGFERIPDDIRDALDDFGIDPETWKHGDK